MTCLSLLYKVKNKGLHFKLAITFFLLLSSVSYLVYSVLVLDISDFLTVVTPASISCMGKDFSVPHFEYFSIDNETCLREQQGSEHPELMSCPALNVTRTFVNTTFSVGKEGDLYDGYYLYCAHKRIIKNPTAKGFSLNVSSLNVTYNTKALPKNFTLFYDNNGVWDILNMSVKDSMLAGENLTLLFFFTKNERERIKYNINVMDYQEDPDLNPTGCALINQSTNLTQNIVSSGGGGTTCFTINESNLYFDCRGNSISANPRAALAFNISSVNKLLSNISIQNCIVNNFSTAINITGAANVTFVGGNIGQNSNKIGTKVDFSIKALNSIGVLINHSKINSTNITMMWTNVSDSKITNNYVTTITAGINAVLLIAENKNVFIDNSTFITLDGEAIRFDDTITLADTNVSSTNITIVNSLFSADNRDALRVSDAIDNSTFINNTFINSFGGRAFGWACMLENARRSEGLYFFNNTCSSVNKTGMTIRNVVNSVFVNMTFIARETMLEINGSSNVTIENSTFKNGNMSIRSYLDSNISLVNVRVANYTFNNTLLSMRYSSFGEVNFLSRITGIGSNLTLDINVSNNSVLVNTTRSVFLNVSANITLYNIGFTNPQVIVDYNEDNAYEICASPLCTEFSYASSIFSFNVSSFTRYGSNETFVAPPGIPAPSINLKR